MNKNFKLIFILFFILSCGNGNSTSFFTSNNSENSNSNQEPILTEKLIGTPFEGFTIGDTFTDCTFTVNEFFTETVTEEDLPIPVFAAFFTSSEEEAIQEAIEIANDAMKPTLDDPDTGIDEDLLVFVDEWRNDARVIIKVDNTFGAGATINTVGQATTFGYRQEDGGFISDTYITDWEIRLASIIDINDLTMVIAHELGHALGIFGHRRINYDEEDTTSVLEEDSIMGINGGTELNDYYFMMRNQAEILLNNFGITGMPDGNCIAEGEFGDTE